MGSEKTKFIKCWGSQSKLHLLILIIRWNYIFKERLYKDLIVTSNAISRGTTIFSYFKEIKKFLEKNPNEFIILKVRGEGKNLKGFCKNIIANYLIQTFQDMMVVKEDLDTWFKIEKVTIGEIRQKKRKLLIMVDKHFFKDFINYNEEKQFEDYAVSKDYLMSKGIFCNDDLMKDQKIISDNITILLQNMESSFSRVNRKKLRVNQYIFSIQKKLRLKYLFKPPTINKLETNEFLEDNKAMTHIIKSIYENQDVNIGKLF